jgi:threonine synthase
VANAFHGVTGTRVVVLYPAAQVSERQERQMATLGDNVTALRVQGTFDDCQRLVKGALADRELAGRLALTSANSINVGRLLPQMAYYAAAHFAAPGDGRRTVYCVPSGNFGNLTAGLMAERLGLPARRFLAATNANDVVPEYLETGRLEPRPSVRTLANAMDVGDPSNLERIRWLYREDLRRLGEDVTAVSLDDDVTRACIASVFARTGYVLDPHTAVGYAAHEAVEAEPGTPTVVLATAHPAKFPEVVEEAIGRGVPVPPGIASVMDAEEHMEEISADLASLSAKLDAP